jgi:hypothetical protein
VNILTDFEGVGDLPMNRASRGTGESTGSSWSLSGLTKRALNY